ncbi:MAG: ATP-binding protein [Immundisolibacterales bacterium]|nr:ATP-binding protein [Immundisolibacterales bacterium]
MTLRLLRLWPEGMAGRLGLLLLAGFGLFALVAGLLLQEERSERRTESFARTLSVRVVAMVEALEVVPAAERGRLRAALSDRRVQVRLLRGRPQGAEWQPPEHVDEGAAVQVQRLRPRPVLMRLGAQSPDAGPGGRPRLLVAAGLKDGAWAEFAIRTPREPRPGMYFWLGLAALLVALVLVWGAHRMTRPLRAFAEAADRLGLDAQAPALPEHGSRELRQATRAFNRMTARIRRLVDDRTLLLAAVSHDLRTMLTRLRLRAELIEDREQREKAAADLDEMNAMLDATLAFARDEAADERPGPVDLAALLRTLVEDLSDAGRSTSYDGPRRLVVSGRPVALRRLFENLLDNAVRYGGEARAALQRRGEGRVEVLVDDRGPGIPEALRERVFDPFFRVEGSRSRDTGGTGLGLAVVRAIVRRHDGTVRLEDRPDGGLRVRVTLPLDATASSGTAEP